jgi:prepilin-type N-terminal cleavage/methylation domain-containing protein
MTICARKPGFTLVEAVMAMLIVSLLLVAAMRAVGASTLMQYKAAERTTGRLLAAGLMSDILALSYEDPLTTPAFGIEAGESASSKATFDDIDDYNGWTESPLQERDGTVMSNLPSGWRRSVVVQWVNPTTLTQVMSSESGLKQITVSVRHNNVVVATRVAMRSKP